MKENQDICRTIELKVQFRNVQSELFLLRFLFYQKHPVQF